MYSTDGQCLSQFLGNQAYIMYLEIRDIKEIENTKYIIPITIAH